MKIKHLIEELQRLDPEADCEIQTTLQLPVDQLFFIPKVPTKVTLEIDKVVAIPRPAILAFE